MIIISSIKNKFLFISLFVSILSCKNENRDKFETIRGNNNDYKFDLFIDYYKDSINICYWQDYKGESSKRLYSLFLKNNEYYSTWQEILTPNGEIKNEVFMSVKKHTTYYIDSAPPNNHIISFFKINDNNFKSDYTISGITKYRRTIYYDSNYRINKYELMFGDSLLIFKRK